MRTEKLDIYGEITKQIVEAIEAGADNYQMPWHANGADSVLPVNVSTHRPYRGINVMMLWAVAAKKEYPTSLWATYQHALDRSGQPPQSKSRAPFSGRSLCSRRVDCRTGKRLRLRRAGIRNRTAPGSRALYPIVADGVAKRPAGDLHCRHSGAEGCRLALPTVRNMLARF